MPCKCWTTTDQLDWLQPWIPAFTKAQESKEFNSFFVEMYDAWFKKYPLAAHIVKYCFVLSKTDMDFIL